jgi:hypothetical protein
MVGWNTAAASALLFACYWIGLQFVGLDDYFVVGAGSYFLTAIYVVFAIGLFLRVKGFAIGCALTSFGLIAVFFLVLACCSESTHLFVRRHASSCVVRTSFGGSRLGLWRLVCARSPLFEQIAKGSA